MSDRVKGFIVVIEEDIDQDYADGVANAIELIKGVLSVEDIPDQGINDHINRERIRREFIDKMWEVIKR